MKIDKKKVEAYLKYAREEALRRIAAARKDLKKLRAEGESDHTTILWALIEMGHTDNNARLVLQEPGE